LPEKVMFKQGLLWERQKKQALLGKLAKAPHNKIVY